MVSNTDFEFDAIAFFGRNIEEYVAMFDLDLNEMVDMDVLDCPAGPSAFALQAAERGIYVTACDPLYAMPGAHELRSIVDRTCANIAEKQTYNRGMFHKELVPVHERRKSMEIFLEDYEEGRRAGRYLAAQLPELAFADQSFDYVLSGNMLFLYADLKCGGMMENSPLDFQFHKRSLQELVRVARRDVRVYPLVGPEKTECTFLQPLLEHFRAEGLSVSLKPVAQRDIIGAEQMLVISRV